MNRIFSLFSKFGVFFRILCALTQNLYVFLTACGVLFFFCLCFFFVNKIATYVDKSLYPQQKKEPPTAASNKTA